MTVLWIEPQDLGQVYDLPTSPQPLQSINLWIMYFAACFGGKREKRGMK
jgi:hypothetical protein